jgi:nicotinate-nucleotide adenylyltransferase
VLFAPVGAQPLKPQGSTAGFEDRLAMTRLAIAGEPGFAVSLADAPKSSRRAQLHAGDAARAARRAAAGSALFCLMGADSRLPLRRWHRAAEIPFVAPLIVASRPGQRLDDLRPRCRKGLPWTPLPQRTSLRKKSSCALPSPQSRRRAGPVLPAPGLEVEISASEIREQMLIREQARASPEPPPERALLPEAVSDYIRAHGLYR